MPSEDTPIEDVPFDDTSFDDTSFDDTSFDPGVGWSDEELSLLGDPGADLVGDETVGDEMAIGDTAGYDDQGEPELGEDRQSHQEPAPASPTARVVGGVLIAGAVVVMVGGALRRRSIPVLSRRK